MAKSFQELEIDGAFINELTVVPSKKLRIGLLRGFKDENAPVGREYDLQFNQLRSFSFGVKAAPWLEIVSHNLLLESEYLANYLANRAERGKGDDKLHHFQIVCAGGQLDVIAEHFTISLINEIPYYELTPAGEIKQEGSPFHVGDSVHKEPVIKCSFCGKEQSEVSKIITGAVANICNECVATCSNLMDK